MAEDVKDTAVHSGDEKFPAEAYDYNDDVSEETVAKIRAERGVDVSSDKWETIDALGQVVPA